MRQPDHSRKAVRKDSDPVSANNDALRARQTADCKMLRDATLSAIDRQAKAWGIGRGDATTLLLDRRMPA